MSVDNEHGASRAEREIRTMEQEAAHLRELADARKEHARELREDASHEADEVRRLKEKIREEEEEIAHDTQEASHEEDEASRDEEEARRLEEEARRKHHHHEEPPCEVRITAIVAGKDVLIVASLNDTLAEVRATALEKTENVGQPPENWEIKDEQGTVLDPAKTVGECHFEAEVTLFITLKAGVAGDTQSVDPAVSRAKFDREIGLFRKMEAIHRGRGLFVVDATFPEVFVLVTTPKTKPAAIAAAVIIDFTDYDLKPPSVTFVDPFTKEPIPQKELGLHMLRRAPAAGFVPQGFPQQFAVQDMIQANSAEDRPFICLPGIREYHDNPGHSGDSWLLHRNSSEGSLDFILEKIWLYGSNLIEQLQVQLQPVVTGFAFQQTAIPE